MLQSSCGLRLYQHITTTLVYHNMPFTKLCSMNIQYDVSWNLLCFPKIKRSNVYALIFHVDMTLKSQRKFDTIIHSQLFIPKWYRQVMNAPPPEPATYAMVPYCATLKLSDSCCMLINGNTKIQDLSHSSECVVCEKRNQGLFNTCL